MTEKNKDILALAIDRFRIAKDSDNTERLAAEADLKFAIDDEKSQWPKTVRQNRENDRPPRPCLVLNKIPEKIDQVEGDFRQARPTVKVRPVDSKADPKIAEIMGGIIRHIEYHSSARSAYNTSHGSVLLCGRGAWRIDVEDAAEDPFVRDIKINRIPNVFTVYWDPGAKKQDKSDANYIFVTEELSEKEFKAQYPGVELMDWDASNETIENWRTEDTIRVCEYWWKEKTKKTFYQVERLIDGIPTVLTVTEAQQDDKIKQEKRIEVPQVKWAKMIHSKIIDGPHDWASEYIPIVIEIGKEVNISGESKTRGMVRFAKEPQRMYNYWSSSTTEQIALAPKAPYLATGKMIGPHQAQWDQANIKNFPYLLYEADPTNPVGRPTREPPPQMSSAAAHELARMDHDIMSAMGIYEASLGERGDEKSGKAILARQRQGNIGSYTYTDNFEVAYVYSTKILIDLIPYVYDTERIIRIRGEDDSEKVVPINARPGAPVFRDLPQGTEQDQVQPKEGVTQYVNDLTIGKYDVVATIGPSYTTQRQEALAMLLDLAGQVPQFAAATIDLIIKNIDVPGSEELIKRAKRLVPIGIRDLEPGEEPQQPPEQPPDPKVMVEMAKLEAQTIRDELEAHRKDFEMNVKAIADLTRAEAAERGQQLQEIMAFVQEIRANMPQQGRG